MTQQPADRPESEQESQAPRSGLRNPPAAVRGVGMAALLLEALVLLLALRPIQQLSDAGGVGAAAIGVLIVCCLAVTGLLRRDIGWIAGWFLQGLIAIVGLGVHWSLVAVAVLFTAIWWYVMRVRKLVLSSS